MGVECGLRDYRTSKFGYKERRWGGVLAGWSQRLLCTIRSGEFQLTRAGFRRTLGLDRKFGVHPPAALNLHLAVLSKRFSFRFADRLLKLLP